MYRPSFAPTYRVRRGPADESDSEEDGVSVHGPTYARTPFPVYQHLGSPESGESDPVVPGRRPRSRSNPAPSPFPIALGGSAFGSPIGSPPTVDHGPYQPPQPHIQPAKSAMRRSQRRTMDGFSASSFPFPQGDQLPPPGATPYVMGQNPYVSPQNPYVSPRNPYVYPSQPGMPPPQPSMPLPYMTGSMGPTPRSTNIIAMPPFSPMGFPMPGGQRPMMPPGYHPGMPQPGVMPHGMIPPGMVPASSDMGYQQMHDSQRRKQKRRRRRGESEESGSSSEGVVPGQRHEGHANPLPQPPRVFPVPAVSPNGSILVDSPPATGVGFDAPPIPPKPPPNPLPTPPKAVIEDAQKSAALQAAAEDVKRAKERTERARDKAIARLEADTWAAAGVPVGVTEDGEPHVPLIPGKTAPAVYSNVGKGKERHGSNEEEESEHRHGLGGLTGLLKRMSTRHRSDVPPPVAPKPAKPARASTQPPLRRPLMPTHNSGDIPRDEGVFPLSAGVARSASVSHLPFANDYGPVVNGKQFAYPHTPGLQTPMQYDSHTKEYFDPSNGLWWNPNTRKYYNRRAATLATVPAKGKDKEGGGGLMSMIKRWTTNTAPDHQPKPITAQLVLPTQPGATAGLKGVKAVGTVPPIRRSMQQQQQRIQVYPDHPQAMANSRRRANSAVTSKRGTMPWSFPPDTPTTNPGFQPGVMPNGAPRGWPPGFPPSAIAAASAGVSQVPQANVYFSRKNEPYGGFRLDSTHSVSWGGVDGPTALHWFESGRFENIGTGLGAEGMGTGWTFPSTMGLRGGGGKAKGLLKVLGKGGDEGSKKGRLEYVRARTEESDHILRLRTAREIQVASTNAQLEGSERRDWQQVWRKKLEEILYLKFQQHAELRNLLLGTGAARIIFNHEDSLLGDGGNVNGNSNNGENELGQALMRVRFTMAQQLEEEE